MLKDPRRPLLVGAIVLLGVAAGMYFGGMRDIAQWLLLAGAIFCLLYFVIRRMAKTPDAPRHPESALFSQTTTMEAQIESGERESRHRD